MKIALCTANLGSIDNLEPHVPQSLPFEHLVWDDKNFKPRHKSLHPRLQAKIPKFFAWQMKPGFDFYIWIDSNLTFTNYDSVKWLVDACQDVDSVVLKHPKRNTIKWEARYIQRGMKEQSIYLTRRYENELGDEQMAEILADKSYVDDLLVNGGIFIYRDTPAIRAMFKEWWYFTSRYTVMDQCAFAYCIKTSGVKYKVLPEVFNDCPYLQHRKHYWNR